MSKSRNKQKAINALVEIAFWKIRTKMSIFMNA